MIDFRMIYLRTFLLFLLFLALSSIAGSEERLIQLAQKEALTNLLKAENFCYLVCVFDVKIENLGKIKSRASFHATIVKTIKGEGAFGDVIQCEKYFDLGSNISLKSGQLYFVFGSTQNHLADKVVTLGDGEFPRYSKEIEKIINN